MDLAAWVAAVAAVLSMIVSIVALAASTAAKRASDQMSKIDEKLELSLSRFKDALAQERVFASEEVTDLRLKGVDNSIRDLDHRTNRNTEHIAMIFKALLTKGLDAQTKP